jgi:predicted lipoprotein with Yx(FWY)xxD motif
MAAVGQADTGVNGHDPGGGEAEGVPAGGAGRVWRRAVAGALSAIGLAAAALSLALVLAVPGGPAGATTSSAHGKSVKISTAKVASVGTVLTTASGLTLYHFTEDSPGRSTCNGACAKIWPPLLAARGAHVSGPHGVKGFSLLKAANGHWQVAWHKLPLYTFEGDKKKGQAHGQNVGQVWFAVLKSGIPVSAIAGAAGATSTTAPSTPATAPVTGTTAPAAPSTQGSTAGSSNAGAGSGATMPTQAPTPATQPPTPVTQPPAPSSTPPPTSPPPTSPPPTPTTSTGGGGYGY